MIKEFQDRYCAEYVPFDKRDALQGIVQEIMTYNIAYKDASHAACAIYANCDYLLTTDIRFQKRYKGGKIAILNPLEFVTMIEEGEL